MKNGKVITHPLSNFSISGNNPESGVGNLCRQSIFQLMENAISENELFEMDELIIAGTGSEITPVVQVGMISSVGNKKPGEITRFIQQKFFELV